MAGISFLASIFCQLTGSAIANLWDKLLGGDAVPPTTYYGMNYGYIVLIISGLLSTFLACKEIKIPYCDSSNHALLIAIFNIIYLSMIGLTYCLPMTRITWPM